MFDFFSSLKAENKKFENGMDNEPMTVTKDTIIGEVLDMDPTTAPFFFEIGMHCLGCPASRGESIEDACAVHGVDCAALLEKLNAHMSKNAQ